MSEKENMVLRSTLEKYRGFWQGMNDLFRQSVDTAGFEQGHDLNKFMLEWEEDQKAMKKAGHKKEESIKHDRKTIKDFVTYFMERKLIVSK